MNDRETIQARVRLFLECGMTYNEALCRAYANPAPQHPVQVALHLNGQPIGS
jgi:hypothetical protein